MQYHPLTLATTTYPAANSFCRRQPPCATSCHFIFSSIILTSKSSISGDTFSSSSVLQLSDMKELSFSSDAIIDCPPSSSTCCQLTESPEAPPERQTIINSHKKQFSSGGSISDGRFHLPSVLMLP
ncbi:hypothetical protein Hanom_Chr15g01362581 [Helianthus anomalus]